ELVDRMVNATKNLDYEGIFVYTRGNNMDVMQILHKRDENGEREKLLTLTGHAREIIRNNDTVTCIFPDKQEVMVERSRTQGFTSRIPETIDLIAAYYDFSTIGEERVAGRDAWVVKITPKDEFRYGYQLWIDKQNYLLLKSEMQDDEGTSLETVMFTELQLLDSIEDERFLPSISGNEFTWHQFNQHVALDENNQGANYAWQVAWIPDGFRQNSPGDRISSNTDSSMDHMIFTDGISTVSIFIERLNNVNPINNGALNMGGVNVYSTTTGNFQVTAIGEVPQPTVIRMADSVVSNR
ncbi:MAG: outer membrane lipoprotein-sorting protein, partial [Gammaproteobacteria bacterium]|nr:outer membrane lipoprotein-sorting protein [Gammaproteobacteria bacterium]